MYKPLFVALLLCAFTITQAFDEIQEPRTTISQDVKNFATLSDWEGIYGAFSLCSPTSVVPGWCYKQMGLSIYDCMRTNEYHYEDSAYICKLGAVIQQIPNKSNPNEHMICDSTSFPGEIEILINGAEAHPRQEYYQMLCDDAKDKAQCEKNVRFSLKKDTKGISFISSKGLDSMTCETPLDERSAGTLKAHYPNLKASFDCAKQGLSRVEKGICNSFYTAREDYMLNVAYNFIMDFADEQVAKTTKKDQMQWLKTRNLQCNEAQSASALESCLLTAYSHRAKELKTIIEGISKSSIQLHSQTGQILIFESPSQKSPTIYTAMENEAYEAYLADKQPRKDFVKIIFRSLSHKTNPNNNEIIGYIRTQNMKPKE